MEIIARLTVIGPERTITTKNLQGEDVSTKVRELTFTTGLDTFSGEVIGKGLENFVESGVNVGDICHILLRKTLRTYTAADGTKKTINSSRVSEIHKF